MNIKNAYLAYKIIDLLSTDFKNWEAYEYGLIDEEGNLIKKPYTQDEKDSYGIFHRVIRKIKVIMNKFIGKSKMSAMLSTLYLMRENVDQEIISLLILELCKLDPQFKKYLSTQLTENLYSFKLHGDELIPGKYYINLPDKEKKLNITESIKPIDQFYNFPVYKYDDIIFLKDQIRRIIAEK